MALAKCTGSKSGTSLLRQATERWPERKKDADGQCPSEEHHEKNPSSYHEPNAQGVSRAVDLTHDPAHGCACDRISEETRRAKDKRVRRCIHNRRQWTNFAYKGIPAYTWRPYTGTNPHAGHMHLDLDVLDDDSPWPGVVPPKVATVKTYRLVAGWASNLAARKKVEYKCDLLGVKCVVDGPAFEFHASVEKTKQIEALIASDPALHRFHGVLVAPGTHKGMGVAKGIGMAPWSVQ